LKIAVGIALALIATTAAACGSTSKPSTSTGAEPSGPSYPSPRIGNRSAYYAAFQACDDGITVPAMCRCIAAELSQRTDAASLDYPTLLDYNNPNPPGYLVLIDADCAATP
jgi:hypothetical protein